MLSVIDSCNYSQHCQLYVVNGVDYYPLMHCLNLHAHDKTLYTHVIIIMKCNVIIM